SAPAVLRKCYRKEWTTDPPGRSMIPRCDLVCYLRPRTEVTNVSSRSFSVRSARAVGVGRSRTEREDHELRVDRPAGKVVPAGGDSDHLPGFAIRVIVRREDQRCRPRACGQAGLPQLAAVPGGEGSQIAVDGRSDKHD